MPSLNASQIEPATVPFPTPIPAPLPVESQAEQPPISPSESDTPEPSTPITDLVADPPEPKISGHPPIDVGDAAPEVDGNRESDGEKDEPVATDSAVVNVQLQEKFGELQMYVRQLHGVNDRLSQAMRVKATRQAELQNAKNNLSSAQSVVDEITEELNDLLQASPDPDRYPLFADKSGGSDLPLEPVASAASETVTNADDPSEAWRDVQIEALGLPQSINDKLREHEPPIKTIGDISTFNADHPFTAIKGIGAGKAEKIEDALIVFWEKEAKGPRSEVVAATEEAIAEEVNESAADETIADEPNVDESLEPELEPQSDNQLPSDITV